MLQRYWVKILLLYDVHVLCDIISSAIFSYPISNQNILSLNNFQSTQDYDNTCIVSVAFYDVRKQIISNTSLLILVLYFKIEDNSIYI